MGNAARLPGCVPVTTSGFHFGPGGAAAQYSILTKHLRGFGLHYAVKALLPHPAVLTVLAACGSGFDVATTAEVDIVAALDVPMARCIYTPPVKKPADIDYAYRRGIRTFVVDNPAVGAPVRPWHSQFVQIRCSAAASAGGPTPS